MRRKTVRRILDTMQAKLNFKLEPGIIRQTIAESGLNNREIAQMLGVSRPLVSQWASGKKLPSLRHLGNLCALTGLDPVALWPGLEKILRPRANNI